MKISHLNIRTLVGHFTDFKNTLLHFDFDVCTLNETRLDSSISSESINIEGYNLIRCDRNRRGGGVAIYLKRSMKYSIVKTGGNIEQIWIKILNKNCETIIGTIYRPPDFSYKNFWSYFESSYVDISPLSENIICLGDFNTDLLSTTYESDFVKNVLHGLGLEQILDEPTRIVGNSATLIDYILVSNLDMVSESSVMQTNVDTDHEFIQCKLNFKTPKQQPVFKTIRDFKYILHEQFQSDLKSIPWRNIYDLNDINEKISFINSNLITLLDLHAPLKTIRITKKYAPWLTENLKLMMKERDKLLARYKRTKNNNDWTSYKSIRNAVCVTVKREKKAYYNAILSNSDSKHIWQNLKSLNILNKKSHKLPENLADVESLNKHFIESIQTLAEDRDTISFYKNNLKNSNLSKFSFVEVAEENVAKIINNIKTKAKGCDEINILTLKLCLPFLLPYVTHVINFALKYSVFPSLWKKALVIPLPKNNDPSDFDHVRPISILPTLSKVLEKVLQLQLQQFLIQNNILPERQSGFRQGYSCTTALLNLTDDILLATDQGLITLLVMLDYSKAFNCINFEVMLAILHHIGLSDNAINLLSDYLHDRSQAVAYEGRISNFVKLTSGVPQGSILGPLLFLIYTSNFTTACISAEQHFYADDSQIKFSFELADTPQAVAALNFDLCRIYEISKKHSLSLNTSKSIAMIFGKNKLVNEFLDVHKDSIILNNEIIKFDDNVRNLGLTMDSNLRFSKHISNCLGKSYSNLRHLYQCKDYLNSKNRTLLCESLVLSNFNFCDVVYGPCLLVSDQNRIQRLQNSCLRFIHGIRRDQHISHYLKTTGWLSMQQRRFLHSSTLFFKILTNTVPEYLFKKVKLRSESHNLNTRSRNFIELPKHNSEMYKRSYCYQICKIMNSLNVFNLNLKMSQFRKLCIKRLSDDLINV